MCDNVNEIETKSVDPASDPYFYTKLDEFTSEVYKIEVSNLPGKCGYVDIKKRLATLNLIPKKIKLLDQHRLAYINFSSEEERSAALAAVNGHTWKNYTLSAKKANPIADPMVMKRKLQNLDDAEPDEKTRKTDEEDADIPLSVRLNNTVTPLWQVPYNEQLDIKQKSVQQVLKVTFRQMERDFRDLKPWLAELRKKHGLHCCNLLPIIPSPVTEKYRNKCEFTIGLNTHGKDKVVGFRLGKYKGGSSCVEQPGDCVMVPDAMKTAVKMFEDCIESSKYTAFDTNTHTGNWRQLTVRTSLQGHMMVCPEFKAQDLPQDVIDAEMGNVRSYFSVGPGRESGVSSLYFSVTRSKTVNAPGHTELTHTLGDTTIQEEMLGLKFRISPEAFFQINTQAAELLYDTIGQWVCESRVTTNESNRDNEEINEQSGENISKESADICENTSSDNDGNQSEPSKTVLLDVCCGTGTIGLTLAKRVQKVVGIEMCEQAVADARENALINGITNAEFHCGKAEDLISSVMSSLASRDVVAVVDPPRPGLHTRVVHALRRCHDLRTLIYVSCSPKSAQTNFVDLMRPESKRMRGSPFTIVKAVPVDLFPHTNLCELVIVFQR